MEITTTVALRFDKPHGVRAAAEGTRTKRVH